jgi:plasmid maintenance system killer protein
MELFYSEQFRKSYRAAPAKVQRALDRRVRFLAEDLRHPSLRAKKYDETRDIWQARVNGGWRFYFQVAGNAYHLIDIIPHPK